MNTERYNKLSDDDLKNILIMRLVHLRYAGRMDNITVEERQNINSSEKPLTIRFTLKNQYGLDKKYLLFERFYIDEWDYIHEKLEQLNIYPVSDFIRKKNSHIVDLEISNRGYLSAFKSIKEKAKLIHDQISV